MTAKQIAGYLKARRDQSKSTFGGISFNDGYNVPTYGITQADYYAIDRSMNDEYGMMASSNLTTAGVKKALRNHPISAKGPSVHHATKAASKSQREMYYDAERRSGEINKTFLEMLPTMRRRDLEQLIEKRPALWGRFAGYLTSGHVFVDDPSAGARHHSTKKSPARLQREIDEVLAKPVASSLKIRLPPGEPAAWAHRHLSKANTPKELAEIWRAMKKPGTGMGAYYASRTGIAQSEINSVYQQHRARLGAP